MVLSMTGFARGKIDGYVLEIQSINKKGMEFSLSLPRELFRKESLIRRKCGALLQRGHVFLKVFREGGVEPKVSKEMWKKVHENLLEIASSLDSSYKVSFDHVLQAVMQFDFPTEEEGGESEKRWEAGIEELWQVLLQMKEKEGALLAKDITERCGTILTSLERLYEENKKAPDIFQKKILDRLEGFKAILDEDRDRVCREVVLYAEKCDITEEVVRMRSHISQVLELLKGVREPIGRTLDFLVQEMMREANTMGSKTPVSVHEVIFIKSEIEKIRQQGSNIE